MHKHLNVDSEKEIFHEVIGGKHLKNNELDIISCSRKLGFHLFVCMCFYDREDSFRWNQGILLQFNIREQINNMVN